MYRFLAVVSLLCSALGFIDGRRNPPRVEPEYLDHLRREGRYEEFSYYIGANDPKEVIPAKGIPKENDWPSRTLCRVGPRTDRAEEERQGFKFENKPEWYWLRYEDRPFRVVPFRIEPSSSNFSPRDEKVLLNTLLKAWNDNVPWIKWVNYRGEEDYVYIYYGTGCSANLGRKGGQQGLQLTEGCVNQKSLLHEMMHTVGMGHEHARVDRDNYIRILKENIYENATDQYSLQNPNDFDAIGEYDFYTFMHYFATAFTYGQNHSFEVLVEGIDVHEVGSSPSLTKLDIGKLKYMYDRPFQ